MNELSKRYFFIFLNQYYNFNQKKKKKIQKIFFLSKKIKPYLIKILLKYE